MNASLNFPYVKMRKDFGRQPMFCESQVVMLDTIEPNKADQKLYGLRNPVNRDAQTLTTISEHNINTKRVTLQDQGINHAEGGWPKDINFNDEEATARYRRRVERDDAYVDVVLSAYPKVEHYVKQNNAIEMYNMYFAEMKPEQPVEKSFIRINNVFRDCDNRNVASISWTHEDDTKLAVAYCNKNYPVIGSVNKNLSCSVWDIENPNEPLADFLPPTACWQIVCFPVHPKIIIGGLEDGRVCVFDMRYKNEPFLLSPMHLAHRDPVSALVFMYSRLNNDFFSGSSDGKCLWWDIRNLSSPTDTLIMSVRGSTGERISLTNAEGVSSLQYDKSFPAKFLCGTDTGFVINVNRKGKTYQEIMSAVFSAHNGPVKAVQRSPCTSKMFITCGDWTSHIWSEDIHSSPIIYGTRHRQQITDVAWVPQRVSSYMTICADGKFRYWDLLRKYREPTLTLPISKNSLTKLVPNEEGRLVAIGDSNGALYLISLSDNLVISGSRDKLLMTQCLDREARREHILEARVKEIKLKLKAEAEATRGSATKIYDEHAVLKETEDEYKRIIFEEMRRTGVTPYASLKKETMRKR